MFSETIGQTLATTTQTRVPNRVRAPDTPPGAKLPGRTEARRSAKRTGGVSGVTEYETIDRGVSDPNAACPG